MARPEKKTPSMKDREHQQPDTDTGDLDDSDSLVQITSLPLDQVNAPVPLWLSSRWLLKARLPRKQRSLVLRLSVILSFILLIVLVLPGSATALSNIAAGALNSLIPVSTPTPPWADRFYFDTEVPWTTVLLDGHSLHVPRIGIDAPLQLAQGSHIIEWQAAPFLKQSCRLDVLPTSQTSNSENIGSCFTTGTLVPYPPTHLSAQLIDLTESLATLPEDQQTALTGAVQNVLDDQLYSETVQPGEQYSVTRHGILTAKHPVQAMLSFQFSTEIRGIVPYPGDQCLLSVQVKLAHPCQIGNEDCLELCTIPWQLRQERGDWRVLAVFLPLWRYHSGNEQLIDFGGTPTIDHLVALSINLGSTGWFVQPLFDPNDYIRFTMDSVPLANDPACAAAEDLLAPEASYYVRLYFISGLNPAAGCLIEAKSKLMVTPEQFHPPIAYYLERFGVLLALNDVAHIIHPHMPQADAYEQALAQQLTAFSGQTVELT
jgi:hypothetical protein